MTDRVALPPVAPRPAAPGRSDRLATIVEAAGRLVAAEGASALTMRRVAGELGIKAPSLYKHVPGREGLVAALVDDALFALGDRLHEAVRCAADPITALLREYRRAGGEQPHLYRLATATGLPREHLTPGLEEWAGEPFYRATGDPYLAQALWAFAHGTMILELDGRFLPGSDLGRTWQEGARAFAAAAADGPTAGGRPSTCRAR